MSVKKNLFVMGAIVLAWLWMPQKGQGEETIITVKSGGKEVSISGKLSPNQIGDLIGKLLDQKNEGGLPADDQIPDGLKVHGHYGGENRAPVEALKEKLPTNFFKLETWLKEKIYKDKVLPKPVSEADYASAMHDVRLAWARQITKNPDLGFASDDPLIDYINNLAVKDFQKAATNLKDPPAARSFANRAQLFFRAQTKFHLVNPPNPGRDDVPTLGEKATGNPFGTPVKPWIYTGDKDGNYKIEDGTGKVEEGTLKVQDQLSFKGAKPWPETPQDPELAARPMPQPAAPVYEAPELPPLYVVPPQPVYMPQPTLEFHNPPPSWNNGYYWRNTDWVGHPEKVRTKRPAPRWRR